MVAEALLLEFHAFVGTAGHEAAIELILLQQELGGMDKRRVHLIIYRRRYDNMIQTVPLALIAIGALHPITAPCLLGDILQIVTGNVLNGWGVVIVIEVAADQDPCIGCDGPDGIHSLQQTVGSLHTERTSSFLATMTTWGMDYKDVQRIARYQLSTGIEDITRRLHPRNGIDTQTV